MYVIYICNIIILKCNQYLKYYENIAYSFFLVFEIWYVHTLTTVLHSGQPHQVLNSHVWRGTAILNR